MKPILIVGGGISGLTAAFYLQKAGLPVTLVEKDARWGGLLETRVVDGCRIEAGPDSFLSTKSAARELIQEVGLGDEILSSNDDRRRTFLWRNGRMIPMPEGLVLMAPADIPAFVTTPLLSLGAKLKAARELRRKPPSQALPERSIAAFVADHYGQEVVDYLAEPLMTGVFGGDVEKLSASQVLARFVDLEARYGSVTRGLMAERAETPKGGSLFQSLRGGFGSLVDALDRHLTQVQRIRGEVVSLENSGGEWRVRLADGELQASRVILAVRAWQASRIVQSLDGALSQALAAFPFSSAVTIGLTYPREGFPHPLNGFGFLVPKVERESLVACTWVSTKFDHRAPPDRVVLRGFLGGDAWCTASGEALLAATLKDLRRLMGITAEPIGVSIARWPQSMPQYDLGHAERVRRVFDCAAKFSGLYLVGNAFEGIGIPDSIRVARNAVNHLTKSPISPNN